MQVALARAARDLSRRAGEVAPYFWPRAHALERLGDLDLEPARHRLVITRRLHVVGEVLLARRDRVGLVVRVAIALAVAEALHQPRRRIAQVQRHVERAALLRIGHRGLERDVDGVALRGARHEHDGLREREFALGTAEPLVGLRRLQRELQRARIGVADVLGGHADHASRDVARVAAAVEHAAEPVQRRIRVGAAHRLVQRRDLVVELLALLVEAPVAARGHFRRDRLGDDAVARLRQVRRHLEQVQRATCVAVGRARERRDRLVLGGDPRFAARSTRVRAHDAAPATRRPASASAARTRVRARARRR